MVYNSHFPSSVAYSPFDYSFVDTTIGENEEMAFLEGKGLGVVILNN